MAPSPWKSPPLPTHLLPLCMYAKSLLLLLLLFCCLSFVRRKELTNTTLGLHDDQLIEIQIKR